MLLNEKGTRTNRNNAASSSDRICCNFHRIMNILILVATFFSGYLMGVNTTLYFDRRLVREANASNFGLLMIHSRSKNKTESTIASQTPEDKGSSDSCVWKLSTILGILQTDEKFATDSSILALLDNDELEMKKMIEKIILPHRRGAISGKFAAGAVRTNEKEFLTNAFDYGYPIDNSGQNEFSNGHHEILVLYNDKQDIPRSGMEEEEDSNGIPYINDPLRATSNCHEMNVVISQANCLAISMTRKGSFHVQRWSRHIFNEDERNTSATSKLVPVGRGLDYNYDEGSPPELWHTTRHWKRLKVYLNTYEETIKELKVITERIKINNTIIVMVCNFGQSALLMNFICSSRRRKLDISNLLVFVTDTETLELAQKMNVETYFDKKIFEGLPKKSAESYADNTFAAMMYAKVVAVQLINFMGYDCLFQDVDMHWYRNPLLAFQNSSSKFNDFDILLQDDGQRSLRYAPYYGNSGFYYVRHNSRTRFLFNSLLLQGDAILKSGSHQQLLSALLADHASWTGLKVKVLGLDGYPGGFSYHSRPGAVRKIILGQDTRAEIFHMSWTENKYDKFRYMKQMGMWHLKEECSSQKLEDIMNNTHQQGTVEQDIYNYCCSQEPLISCHYRDAPSAINCSTSPPLNGESSPSFWKK